MGNGTMNDMVNNAEETEEKLYARSTMKTIRRMRKARWIILAICVGLSVFILVSDLPPPAHKYDSFAACIAQSGAVFYGAFWCPHCRDQKNMFGTGAQNLPYHECSKPDASGELQSCLDQGVKSYPTWVFKDGSRLTGTTPLATLSQKTGCPLPTSTFPS